MSGTFICGQRSLCFLSGSFRDTSEYLAVHIEANNPSTPFLLSMWGHLTSDPAPILQSLPCAAQSAKLVTWESTTVVEVPGLYLPFLITAFIMAVKSYQLLFSSWDGGRWQTGESNPNLVICFLSSIRLSLSFSRFSRLREGKRIYSAQSWTRGHLPHSHTFTSASVRFLPRLQSWSEWDYTLLHPLTTALSCNYSGEESTCLSKMVLLWWVKGRKNLNSPFVATATIRATFFANTVQALSSGACINKVTNWPWGC